MISQTVAAVKPRSTCMGAEQWLLCANIDRNIDAAEFNGIESVARSLLQVNVPGYSCDRGHAHLGSA